MKKLGIGLLGLLLVALAVMPALLAVLSSMGEVIEP